MEKVSRSPVNHDTRKPSTANQNGFGEKYPNTQIKKINLAVLLFGVGAAAMFFMPWHRILSAVMFFVPWHCVSCHSNSLCAAIMLFLPQHCATCRSIVLCAAASCYVPWHRSLCHGNALHATARLWLAWHCSLCHGKKQCAAVLHSVPCHSF